MIAILDIKGMENLGILDYMVLEETFVTVYNGMCRITNNGVLDAFNKAFEEYYPDEYGADNTYDNAYCTLGYKVMKEIADKVSELSGVLPSGKKVYLDAEEPITLSSDLGTGWFHGYIV